jgi:hypothetical protein
LTTRVKRLIASKYLRVHFEVVAGSAPTVFSRRLYSGTNRSASASACLMNEFRHVT